MNFFMLFIIIISLVFFYLAGSLILFITKSGTSKDSFFDLFIRLTLGLCATVFVYAAIKTKLNTILWGFVLVGIIYLVYRRSSEKLDQNKFMFFDKSLWKPLLIMVGLGIVFFVFQGLFFYNEPLNNMPHGDFFYYSKLILALESHGVEGNTYTQNPFFDGVANPKPYHYPEMWLAALIMRCFNVLSLETQVIAVHSILATILSVGMIALSRSITKSFLVQAFAVISLIMSGILLFRILPQADIYIFATGYNPKTMFISIFFVWFAILCINKNEFFYFPLLMLPIANIAMAPAIFSGLFVYAVIISVYQKKYSYLVKILPATFIIAVLIGLFYLLQSGTSAAGGFKAESVASGIISDKLKPFKIFAGSIVILISVYFLYIIPVFLRFFFKDKKIFIKKIGSIKSLLLLWTIFTICGLGIWSLINIMSDSIQFFYLPALLLLNILLFVILTLLYESNKSLKKSVNYLLFIYILLLALLNIKFLPETPFYRYYDANSRYSYKTMTDVARKIEATEDFNFYGAFLKAPEELVGYWNAAPHFGFGNQLYLIFDGLYTVSLNTLYTPTSYDDPIEETRVNKMLENAVFTKFAKKWEAEYGKTSIDSLQYQYIKENNIEYLIISEKVDLPNTLLSLVDTIFVDDISKQKFVFLSKNY
ncbi:MAG: hypothetical protein LBQ22_07935 [Bacteroidales bacterium]|jgi:hypothetical protein|nr:hypothetical protein [Bacteroidales bacterium]